MTFPSGQGVPEPRPVDGIEDDIQRFALSAVITPGTSRMTPLTQVGRYSNNTRATYSGVYQMLTRSTAQLLAPGLGDLDCAPLT